MPLRYVRQKRKGEERISSWPPSPSCLSPLLRQFPQRAHCNDLSACCPSFRTDVDDPVGLFDDIEVVLDDYDGISQIDQAVQYVEQLGDVIEMEAGGWFVQQIECSSRIGPRQFTGQLHPLCLTAGKCSRALAECHIVEPHVTERETESDES